MSTTAQLPNNAVDFLTATLNSVGATKNIINQISTQSKGTQAERPLQLAGQSLQSHQDQINQLLKFVRAIQSILIINGGGGSSTADGYNVMTLIGGSVTPNLSRGRIQQITMTQDAVLNAPASASGPQFWILIVDQDGTGNWTLTPDPAVYFASAALIGPPLTRIQMAWVLDPGGNNSVCGAPSMGQPIP